MNMIPQELRDYAQWICWQYVEKQVKREGNVVKRQVKMPFNPNTGKPAKVNDPLTWGTYEEACRSAYLYDGIGFVFTEYDPFVGIDIDHCITDGVMTKESYKLMKRFGSYCEKSPSETGIHIIIKGNIRDGRKGARNGKMEVYSQDRYFTVTGNSIQMAPIVSGQDILDYLMDVVFPIKETDVPEQSAIRGEGSAVLQVSDEKLLEALFKQSNGEKIRRLYDGEDAQYGDTSRDDLYFCWLINYRNGNDLEQTDRIFRSSGRMRKKWDTVHFSTGQTYGQRTLKLSINYTC